MGAQRGERGANGERTGANGERTGSERGANGSEQERTGSELGPLFGSTTMVNVCVLLGVLNFLRALHVYI